MRTMLFILMAVLMFGMVSANPMGSIPSASSSSEQAIVQTAASSSSSGGGHGQRCYTKWAWNGESWSRLDVVQTYQKTMRSGEVKTYTRMIDGSKCATYYPRLGLYQKKPKAIGTETNSMMPLPYDWYMNLQSKGGIKA